MSYDPERITFFARTDARGKNVPFGIKAKDRTRHVYVIGKTGMGKSTLLENMAVQDIKNGEGFAFIDPHGQTAETLLDYIPEERMKDVLYFAPHDMAYPVSFNVMEDVGPDKRHLVVSGLMSVFEKIWVDAWSARMAYILQNTLLALLEYPDSTLLGVNRMLSDKNYRKKVVDNIQDPAVRSFWVDEFAKYNERYMQEAGDAIKNKIGQFTANPLIRNIIGQPKSSFDIRKIMDEKKILIMNLSKGLIGETNANLLGSMLTTRIYLAAMSRADLGVHDLAAMPNFYFYVDEFQSFANATFANILSEARKYKLNLTIAHQYIEQMEEDVKNAVFGNVGTIISFRVGPFDAEVLETIFAPKFYAVDICNLGFAQIYLSLMIDGIGSQPFSAVTLPPIEHQGTSFKEPIIHSSREQFARVRLEVEQAINDWHAADLGAGEGDRNPKQKNSPADSNRQHSKKLDRSDRGPQKESRSAKQVDRTPSPRRAEVTEDTKKHTAAKEPAKGKDLGELRSVLASIAQPEKADPGPEKVVEKKNVPQNKETQRSPDARKPSSSNKPSPKQAKESPGQDLRSALAAALAKAPQIHQSEKTVEQKKTISDPKAATENTRHQRKPDISTPASSGESERHIQEEKTNTLDPKQIERMMRVTTNDKSPLK